MYLIGSSVAQKHFFNWFNKNIIYPTLQSITNKYNPISTSNTEEGEVLVDQEVCIWSDSYISYIQKMTDPARIKLSVSRGI